MKDTHEGRLVVKLPTFVLWSCTWPSTCFASGLHLEIVTENLLPVRSFNRLASCSFLSALHWYVGTRPFLRCVLLWNYVCVVCRPTGTRCPLLTSGGVWGMSRLRGGSRTHPSGWRVRSQRPISCGRDRPGLPSS